MCDTLGFIENGRGFFAKNSDRSPNEPQINEYHPAKRHGERRLKATYVTLDQVPETHAVFISRPAWMWGAEIGVNDCSVCIGNEAVFTRGAYAKTGLTGMDLLRLALERAGSAKMALETIIALLEAHGQGGNCGFDSPFYYDNAFLIMDRSELYVLETAGKKWAYAQRERASISNRLSIAGDATRYHCAEAYDFQKKHLEPVYSHFSASKARLAQTAQCLETAHDTADLMRALRTHAAGADPFTHGSMQSPCMHAGGMMSSHTTASMVVELGDFPLIWSTYCSTPCISLYKPYAFGNALPPALESKAYWLRREQFHRDLIGKSLPPEYYSERDELERGWLSQARSAGIQAVATLLNRACEEEAMFYAKWEPRVARTRRGSRRFLAYWKKKNAAL